MKYLLFWKDIFPQIVKHLKYLRPGFIWKKWLIFFFKKEYNKKVKNSLELILTWQAAYWSIQYYNVNTLGKLVSQTSACISYLYAHTIVGNWKAVFGIFWILQLVYTFFLLQTFITSWLVHFLLFLRQTILLKWKKW